MVRDIVQVLHFGLTVCLSSTSLLRSLQASCVGHSVHANSHSYKRERDTGSFGVSVLAQ